MASEGLTTVPSSFQPAETIDRLEAEIKARGMTVFTRIDHAGAVLSAGLSLRPTELLIFGNAKAGTLLMQSNQTIGVDLPLKILVWQDAAAKRHELGPSVATTIEAMAAALGDITRRVAAPP